MRPDIANPIFGVIADPFRRAGFPKRGLLPIIPLGANLSPGSALSPANIGKSPGYYRNGAWSGLGGWTDGVKPDVAERAANWPTGNVGLLAANYPGIDIDTNSQGALAFAEGLVEATFGTGLPRRSRAGAPRALFAFRLKAGAMPFKKLRTEWKFSGDAAGGKPHAVEILAAGQQYVVSGTHPSGSHYEWREGKDLSALGADNLPEITGEAAKAFMDRLRDEIVAAGGSIVSDRTSTVSGEGIEFKNADPAMPIEKAKEALQAAQNTREAFPDRHDFLALVSAFKVALGRHAEEHRQFFGEWSSAADPTWGYADEEFDKIWDSVTTGYTGHEHLIHVARKFGWRGDVELDFPANNDRAADEAIAAAMATEDKSYRGLAAQLVRIPHERQFIEISTGRRFSNDALAESSLVCPIAKQGTPNAKKAVARLLSFVQEVVGEAYLIGDGAVVPRIENGAEVHYYNRWRANVPAGIPTKVTDAEVRPWLDHVSYLVPDEMQRALLLDFFAHVIQRRGTKIMWAPLIKGGAGIGKDLLVQPLARLFGDNYRTVKTPELGGRFTAYLESEIIHVPELKASDATKGLNEHIKDFIAPTANAKVVVERKGIDSFQVENRANFLFFSNHDDSIVIDKDDRRFFVLASDAERREDDYYTQLVDFYEGGGWQAVIAWLRQRDIAAFNPGAKPPMTDGKRALLEATKSPLSRAVEEMVTEGPFRDRIAVTSKEVADKIAADFSPPNAAAQRKATPASVGVEIHSLRWPKEEIKVGHRALVFYVRPGAGEGMSKTELNAAVRKEYLAQEQKREVPAMWGENDNQRVTIRAVEGKSATR